MQDFFRANKGYKRGQPIIAKNSGVFAKADPVGINSDGFLETVSAGQKIIGYAIEDKTCTADNQTVAKYKPEYVYADGVEMIYNANADFSDAYLAGEQYKDFGTVTSGAFQLARANITGGQMKVIGFDPFGESDNDLVICVASEKVLDAYPVA